LSPTLTASLGQVAHFAREYDSAIAYHTAAIELAPDFFPAHLFLGQTLGEAGRPTDAVAALERALSLSGQSPEVLAALIASHAAAGDQREAAAALQQLSAREKAGYVSPVLRAVALVGLDRADEALDALEAARDCRAVDLVWIAVRPAFDRLRSSPRFGSLVQQIGLRNFEAHRL
jgi:tetratricopeptide (TPR) repeat protein